MITRMAYVACYMIIAFLLVATPTPTSALSSCDTSLVNVTVGYSNPASFAVINCTSLPFTTEEVPFVYTIIANGGYRATMLSGASCQLSNMDELSYGGYGCDQSPSCTQHGYADGGYDDVTTVWCLIVKAYYATSGNVTIDSITIEYSPARVETQWHLTNTGQFGGTAGNDVNATGAWSQGAFGNGVVIMISVRPVCSSIHATSPIIIVPLTL